MSSSFAPSISLPAAVVSSANANTSCGPFIPSPTPLAPRDINVSPMCPLHFAAPQQLTLESPSDNHLGPSRKRRFNSTLRLTSPLCSPVRTCSPVRSGSVRPPPMSLVAPRLFVGDKFAAASQQLLTQRNVTHVLNCTDQPNELEGQLGAPTYLRLGLLDSIADTPRIQGALAEGVAFIRHALEVSSGCVLVHCHRGISRSCMLTMAYLISAEQRSAESAFESIRGQRHCCDPNFHYWCAIKEWEGSSQGQGQPAC